MTTSTPTLGTAICRAVAAAVREPDAPLSAWPEQYPGRWATAARVAELLGQSTAKLSHHLQELAEAGELTIAHPWPGGPRGYQPAAQWLDEPTLFALPETIVDERQWMLDELARWAALHGGRAPRQADWSKTNDPDRRWPRWDKVAELFEAEASQKRIRYFIDERCANDCACSHGRHYSNGEGHSFCDGCFDCLGHCPHGTTGRWVGPSGWRYALQLAGLDVRSGND
jgi:hypothetical protein